MSSDLHLVRGDDPSTSKVAAAETMPKLNRLCLDFLNQLKAMGLATANEVAASLADNIGRMNSLRRRASDLERLGLVEVAGVRVCGVTGKRAQVYRVRGV